MKCFKDGDQLCVVFDDFINIQESPALFFDLNSDIAKTIMTIGFEGLPVFKLRKIYEDLAKGVDK